MSPFVHIFLGHERDRFEITPVISSNVEYVAVALCGRLWGTFLGYLKEHLDKFQGKQVLSHSFPKMKRCYPVEQFSCVVHNNHKWPTSGQGGYITPAAWGGPHRSRARGTVRGGLQVGKVATQLLPPGGVTTASTVATESEVAHKRAKCLHEICLLGIPTASERGAESEVVHKWGKVATLPLPPGGSPPLQSGGHRQRWPTSEQGGYTTPVAQGVPTASQRGAESQVAHNWASRLHNPCRLGVPCA